MVDPPSAQSERNTTNYAQTQSERRNKGKSVIRRARRNRITDAQPRPGKQRFPPEFEQFGTRSWSRVATQKSIRPSVSIGRKEPLNLDRGGALPSATCPSFIMNKLGSRALRFGDLTDIYLCGSGRSSPYSALLIDGSWRGYSTLQGPRKKYANLVKQDPGRARQNS